MPHSEPLQPAAAPRRFNWRRLVQYRLRTLLIVMTVIAVWLGWWTHSARQQREAVAALRNSGAMVWYDFDMAFLKKAAFPTPLDDFPTDRSPPWPAWLVDTLGVDYFANVYSVTFLHLAGSTDFERDPPRLVPTDMPVCDGTLELLKGLPALKILDLRYTHVTDAGLEKFTALTALQELDLRDTQITDSGLKHLQGLTALQHLYLDGTQVTDAGVARLKQALPSCYISYQPAPR